MRHCESTSSLMGRSTLLWTIIINAIYCSFVLIVLIFMEDNVNTWKEPWNHCHVQNGRQEKKPKAWFFYRTHLQRSYSAKVLRLVSLHLHIAGNKHPKTPHRRLHNYPKETMWTLWHTIYLLNVVFYITNIIVGVSENLANKMLQRIGLVKYGGVGVSMQLQIVRIRKWGN